MHIVISSGHGKHIRGASCYIDEVDEARRVVEAVARNLRALGTNGAGIDLSPALAELIGIDGLGEVDWEFVEDDFV